MACCKAVLESALGPYHEIVYQRAELKELIAMHSMHGGDLTSDTVSIIGATLDIQARVVKQVCIPSSIHIPLTKASQ